LRVTIALLVEKWTCGNTVPPVNYVVIGYLIVGVRFILEFKKIHFFGAGCYQNLTTLYITPRNYYSNKEY